MKIAILDVCSPEPEFDAHGSIGEMVRAWLAPHLQEAAFPILHIAGDDPLPTLTAYDGYVVTGSEKGVYDEADWMSPLRDFIRAARAAKTPIFGVCFGHQIMADALGGKAEKADKGFVIGAKSFDYQGRSIEAHAMHQDQVTAAPPEAEVIASAPYCPVAALKYEFPALSVQFHPEYRRAFVEDALEVLDGLVGSPSDFAEGRKTMPEANVSEDLFGAEAAAFFRTHLGAKAEAV
ncbi:MAG: type 1 glutamine amidotransferase [Pseudomonadota bacterium]